MKHILTTIIAASMLFSVPSCTTSSISFKPVITAAQATSARSNVLKLEQWGILDAADVADTTTFINALETGKANAETLLAAIRVADKLNQLAKDVRDRPEVKMILNLINKGT